MTLQSGQRFLNGSWHLFKRVCPSIEADKADEVGPATAADDETDAEVDKAVSSEGRIKRGVNKLIERGSVDRR